MPRMPLKRRHRRRLLPLVVVASAAVVAPSAMSPSASAAMQAPGGPGATSHFGLARKDCLGTARNRTSKVWFTVAGGVLSDTYYPTIDNTNVETMQFVVTDGSTFTDLQTRDTTYTAAPLDPSGMSCRVTSTAKNGRYTIVTDYLTDPARASVVIRTRLKPSRGVSGLTMYVRLDPTVNGNGGGGAGNAGADDAVVDTSTGAPVPVSSDVVTQTTAANRTYAQPVFAALRADRPFAEVSSGYAGSASDGLTQLDADRRLATRYDEALRGNVVQTARLDLRRGEATLALGFGATQQEAVRTAGRSVTQRFDRLLIPYAAGWLAYDLRLKPPPRLRDVPKHQRAELQRVYRVSANVLKASEDKTFPGAIVASMASPWGQAVSAGDPGLTYFGSYREVFARDLYETFTGLRANGDHATARDTVRWLFERQQQDDGGFPRNSLVNGETAPDSGGIQLDEVAFPLLMARQAGLTDRSFYRDHVARAARFVVARGPAFGNERWEEQGGYSPSTIAAEIAGLAAAGSIAEKNGDDAGARLFRATADHYQRNIKRWTVTDNGPYSDDPYFIRLSKDGNPNASTRYHLGNGGPEADQRSVVDAGFLELPRLGILPDDDPEVNRTLGLVDRILSRETASGTGYYRYGTDSPGTEDGYGDCHVPDSTDCTVEGKPWAGRCDTQGDGRGSGHLWPVLTAERGEHELATGNTGRAATLYRGMARTASGIGLIPEQEWENPDLPPSPFGTAPECASIGFQNGEAAGSASPLTWSAASFSRLAAALRDGKNGARPVDTVARYIDRTQGGIDLTLTSPENNTTITGETVTVTGSTAAGATVDVAAINTDVEGAATSVTTTAGANGAFSVAVPVPAGTASISAVATAPDGATGFAQRTVVSDVVPGTLLFEATDPDGDDNGPGTYAYPTDGQFRPGAYDLQQFQVFDSGPDTVTFRVRTRDLTPTFGNALGAQLVNFYVRNPDGGPTSTAASFPSRNYSIAPDAAWNRMIEVQGFGQRFVDGTGATVGSVQIRGNAVTRYITAIVPKSALGGTPGSGWSFAVVLAGQDGFSPDQVRGFAPRAEGYQFGVCTEAAAAAGNPICGVDPGRVPKALDILAPSGVSQASVLDPTAPPVEVPGLRVP